MFITSLIGTFLSCTLINVQRPNQVQSLCTLNNNNPSQFNNISYYLNYTLSVDNSSLTGVPLPTSTEFTYDLRFRINDNDTFFYLRCKNSINEEDNTIIDTTLTMRADESINYGIYCFIDCYDNGVLDDTFSFYYDALYYSNYAIYTLQDDNPRVYTYRCRFYFAYQSEYAYNVANNYYNNYDNGYNDGFANGKSEGYREGQSVGYDTGYTEGYNTGFANGETSQVPYDNGYRDGYANGLTQSTRDFGFMNLFTGIADTPILMMRSMFDFSIFGTSVLSVVLSLFTALVVIHLLKRIIK